MKHLHIIIIVLIIILIIFIIYKLIKKPTPQSIPGTATIKTKKNPSQATVNILYTIGPTYTDGKVVMTVTIGSNTVSSSFIFPFYTVGSLSPGGISATMTTINYDQTKQYLNFYYGGEFDSCIFIKNPTNCANFSLSDTNPGATYDMSNVTITGNVITFGTSSDSNMLTLNFPTAFS